MRWKSVAIAVSSEYINQHPDVFIDLGQQLEVILIHEFQGVSILLWYNPDAFEI